MILKFTWKIHGPESPIVHPVTDLGRGFKPLDIRAQLKTSVLFSFCVLKTLCIVCYFY